MDKAPVSRAPRPRMPESSGKSDDLDWLPSSSQPQPVKIAANRVIAAATRTDPAGRTATATATGPSAEHPLTSRR